MFIYFYANCFSQHGKEMLFKQVSEQVQQGDGGWHWVTANATE